MAVAILEKVDKVYLDCANSLFLINFVLGGGGRGYSASFMRNSESKDQTILSTAEVHVLTVVKLMISNISVVMYHAY